MPPATVLSLYANKLSMNVFAGCSNEYDREINEIHTQEMKTHIIQSDLRAQDDIYNLVECIIDNRD